MYAEASGSFVLNSTWNPESLFGDGGGDDVLPSLLPRLTAELPTDEYRVAAVLHPNIWHGHGPGQIRAWLDRSRRGGLILVDPLHDWRQALLAADAVLGDHGSVSYYAAALGTPVLLGAPPRTASIPRLPRGRIRSAGPQFDPYAPLATQLDALLTKHHPLPGPATSPPRPRRSAALLRGLFYRLINIPEPPRPALLEAFAPPAPTRTRHRSAARPDPGDDGPPEIHVARYADPWYEPDGEGHAHVAVHEDTRDPAQLALADVLLRHGAADDPRFGLTRAVDVRGTRPPSAQCPGRLHHGPGRMHGTNAHRSAPPPHLCPDRTRPSIRRSALHAWLTSGRTTREAMDDGLTIRTGTAAHRVTVTTCMA